MSRSQKEIVRDLLIHRGATGVSAREAIYDLHITRMAAIVYTLKQEGYRIKTEQGRGQTARYFLIDPRPKKMMPLCACGHRWQAHIGHGMRCMAMNYPDAGWETATPCPCEKYTEQKVEAS